jgi:phasin
MPHNPQFEIPPQIREFSEGNIERARTAFSQYMDATRKVQEMMASMVPVNPFTVGMKQVQDQSMKFAQQNIEAGLSLASELAKAKDLKEAMGIQSRHAQTQMQAYSLQAQELGRLVAGAAHNAPAALPAAN